MPLKARLDGQELVSFDLTDKDFEALRGEPALIMGCCPTRAIPKRSKLGTPFFAHTRRGDCTSGPETPFHLESKVRIARAARAAGWLAEVEASGHSPDGSLWRADVLCTKNTLQVALEVQRSPQTMAETEARQALYKASGVRGLWLMTRHRQTLEERIYYDPVAELRTPIFFLDSAFQVTRFGCTLETFVLAALQRELVYFPLPGQLVEVVLRTLPDTCWRCKRPFQMIVTANLQLTPKIMLSVDWEELQGVPELLAIITDGFTPELRLSHELGELKFRYSNPRKGRYFSQGCPHCDVLQGDFYISHARMNNWDYLDGPGIPIGQMRLTETIARHRGRWYVRGEEGER